MALNFAEAAKKKIAEVERPPLAPMGTYRWAITKLPEVSQSRDEKWDIVNFSCRVVEPIDAEMDDFKGDPKNITNQLRFMFNKEDEAEFDKSMFRLRSFLENHVGCANDKDTMQQALNNSVNGQFYGYVSWTQDKTDPEIFYANISKTSACE